MSFLISLGHTLSVLIISLGMFVGSIGQPTMPVAPTVSQVETTNTANIDAPVAPVQTPPQNSSGSTTQTSTAPALAATPVNLAALPLGDGKYTTSGARKGYVYVCHVASGGGGAQVTGSWIHGTTWDSTAKTVVAGTVSWPTANISIKLSGNGATRTIATNDLPVGMTTGTFPIAMGDPAHQIDANPNAIVAQNYTFSIPANPSIGATSNCIFGEVGVMTNGVVLNDAFDAEYRDAPAHEVQDSCQGHPNQQGYHYHSLSSCIPNATVSNVIGWAFDGFPITGPTLPDGTRLSSADLDECHGMTSAVTINGKSVSTYHYVMTDDFPYSVSCFKGTSHEPKPSGAPQGGGVPPPPAY